MSNFALSLQVVKEPIPFAYFTSKPMITQAIFLLQYVTPKTLTMQTNLILEADGGAKITATNGFDKLFIFRQHNSREYLDV